MALSNHKPFFIRLGSLAVLLASALFLASTHGCNQGREGDRCNPSLAMGEDECGSGLSCTQPTDCPENYCCPSGPSMNPFCQPGCAGGQEAICAAGGTADCDAGTD
jgi:hypothetical protein